MTEAKLTILRLVESYHGYWLMSHLELEALDLHFERYLLKAASVTS